MSRIIELIDKDESLKNLKVVYPNTINDNITSSIYLVGPGTNNVYIIFCGNYAESPYKYIIGEETGMIDIIS